MAMICGLVGAHNILLRLNGVLEGLSMGPKGNRGVRYGIQPEYQLNPDLDNDGRKRTL